MGNKIDTFSRRVPTGIAGFDTISDGGLPRAGITLILGGPGAGKTVLGTQILAGGGSDSGSGPGLFVAFEESPEKIADNTVGFVWGGPALEDRGVSFLDAQLPQTIERSGQFDLIGLLSAVAAKANRLGTKMVMFDGVDVLLGYLGDAALVRREVLRLREWVHASGMTAIITAKAEEDTTRSAAGYEFLQFMADCVVILGHRVNQGTALRSIRVSKYRGAAHPSHEFPFTITPLGLEITSNALGEVNYGASLERISSGVERLDGMLSGGYYRGSSVLVTGAPGTAKTSLSTAFAQASALRGERTLYVSFDESPDQIVRNAASIGFHLRPYIESGLLVVRSLRGRAENPDAHVTKIRSLCREVQPSHLVIDPLSALGQRGNESEAEGAALQVMDFAKAAGITAVSTSLLGSPTPLSEHTPLNISTIAHTWIHLSYLNQGGERNRALTIVKSRGTGHSNQVRELVLSEEGVTLTDVYSAGGEVLMGTLRWEKENEERRAHQAAQEIADLREQKAALRLAETEAHLATLSRARAIQEAELKQMRASRLSDLDHLAQETDEHRTRRQADAVPLGPDVKPQGGA